MDNHPQSLLKGNGARYFSQGVSLLLCAFLITVGVASARAADKVVVNRTVPKVTAPVGLSFSATPKDAEFLNSGLFAEPLAPIAATTTDENRDLAAALLTYRDSTRKGGEADAVEPIAAFLASHPGSGWAPALQLNLGIIYRQTGHFSKALSVWQSGWDETRGLTDRYGLTLANALVARLSQLEAYLGRKETLKPLLVSAQGRSVGGTAAQYLTDSSTGLYEMEHHPEDSFRCGPLALLRILKSGTAEASPMALQVLQNESPSTDHGLSLSNVNAIATRAGMDYQMAFRSAGAPIIFPAVAHWKVGHFAAIIGQGSNGRYLVQDATFGEDVRVSPATLDEESSGYFLVPGGLLPTGWRSVSTEEGSTVWGRGNTGANTDGGATSTDDIDCKSNSPKSPCTTWAVESMVVGLQLHDTPVGYTPPRGPAINFALYYSHRDKEQPMTGFSYTNFGLKWTFTWLSYVTDTVNASSSASVYLQGGGSEPFTFGSGTATTSSPGPYHQTILTRTVDGSGNSTGFKLTHPDGSYEQYDQAVGTNQFFMTAISDPAGNIVTLTYDFPAGPPALVRLVAITDAIGQVSTITYASGSSAVVTAITDPFGRSASFTYNVNGYLASITDILGITSSYSYGESGANGANPDFINTLTTPYGSTTFTYGDSNTNGALGSTRFLKATDPLGRTSYVEFDQGVDAGDSSGGVMINSSLIPAGVNTCNQFLNYRNTFIFDPNQYALATASGGLNYSLGKVIHWLHSSDGSVTSRVKESEKEPLENRVWYNYPGQPSGSGCSNALLFGVSASGVANPNATNQPSVIGRVLDSGAQQIQTFAYNSSGNVTQMTDPIGRQMTYTYDAATGIDRLTSSNTTSGSQLLETRTYNSDHLPLTITHANGQTDQYQYNAAGQLTRYTDPLGHATALTYDGNSRLKTVQGAIAAAKYTFNYDAVSRVASATDPAGSTIHYTYDADDRQTKSTYLDGTVTKRIYTLLDLTASTDRLSQTTRYQYDADRELIQTRDPAGNITRQGYNLAGTINSISDPKNHATTFLLDAESRVITKQFANGTSMSIAYENAISRMATITDALGQTKDYTYNTDNTVATISYGARQPTPDVSFVYDPSYMRRTRITDGLGTTAYSYYSVNANLGANMLQSVTSPVAGTGNIDVVSYSYDALNRVGGTTVNGAAQVVGFDAIGRVTSSSNPLDTFTYGYGDGTSRITGVSSNSGPTAAMSYFGPVGDELLQQMNISTHSGATSLAQFGFTYNADDNVVSQTLSSPSSQTLTYGYDPANRLVSALIGTGTPQYQYGYDKASNLTSITPNGPTQSFTYNATNGIAGSGYDANGSPLLLAGNSYKWDGENRVVRFANSATNTGSSFTYDGLGRLVRIVDTHAGAITADHSYTWCGSVRCLAHDNTTSGSPVSTQYFNQGAIIGGTSYYYVKDRLGSVTQLVTTSGSAATQYAYDPYGNQSTISGTVISDIGYAGYFNHAASALDFALFRAYDPAHARWLNRDPIAEAGGLNLYSYVEGNSVTSIDPTGLCPIEDKCQKLADELDQLVNAVRPGNNPTAPKGLAQRFRQIIRLPPNELPGHLEQIKARQSQLQKKIDEFINSGCGDPPGFATDYAKMPIPDFSDASQVNYSLAPQSQQQLVQGVGEVSILVILGRLLIIF